MFGPHLTLDLHRCNKEKLSDPKFIYDFLDFFPEFIGMQKFSKPYVENIPPRPNSFDKGGVTGFVILVESHITIHTFPADGFACVDIFSCKDFDQKKAVGEMLKMFGAKKAEKHFIVRGREFVKHYPRSVQASKKIALNERQKAK